MPNADHCRYETHRVEDRERIRIERRSRVCSAFPWWDPRGWSCWIQTFVEMLWVIVVTTVRRLVCGAAEAVEEVARLLDTLLRWAVGILDHFAGVFLTGNTTGYWPIVDKQSRAVPSRPRSKAFTRSFSLASVGFGTPMLEVYREEGVHVEVHLSGGEVEWSRNGGTFEALRPRLSDFPPWDVRTDARVVSYDDARLGEWLPQLPRFDLLAAGGDRLIAKETGTDAIFILILDFPFVHETGAGRRLLLPQSFFKLDPRCGDATADKSELARHVLVPGDDERHPATERFPLFRWLYTNPNAPKVDLMTAWLPPRIWVKADARPRKDTANPPRPYPAYDHVTYLSNLGWSWASRSRVRRSVRYERVLDLGVGSSHFHEQHDTRFGGEADSLSGQGGTIGGRLADLRQGIFGGPTFDAAYRFANGPIEDYGGWVDGTCIYYQLVQLKTDAQIAAGQMEDAFAILWVDEQFAFTERWRVLHIYDRTFASPFQPIVGEISVLEEEYYPGVPFDADRYFCPLQRGFIHPASRMAVARQFVAVTGRDPERERDEVYTVHFAWGTMDKTWRRRLPPPQADLSTLALRGDSTLVLEGEDLLQGKVVRGLWTQRVLPADGQETPSVEALRKEPAFDPRRAAYSHPWRFVAEEAALRLHREFSHYGVLEAVDSRIQAYRVTACDEDLDLASALTREEIESRLWVDSADALSIQHRRLNYTGVAATHTGSPLSLPSLISAAVEDGSKPSRFSQHMTFRLRFRPRLGWLLLLADKREDKLIAFDRPKHFPVVLTSEAPKGCTVRIKTLHHLRNDRDPHGLTVGREEDRVSPPAVSMATIHASLSDPGTVASVRIELQLARDPSAALPGPLATYQEWIAMNLWRLKVGCFDPRLGSVLRLLDAEVGALFQPTADPRIFRFDWTPTPAEQHGGTLAQALSHRGAALHGTSLWCIGSTGLASVPDEVLWST